jgi:hypothetical protein
MKKIKLQFTPIQKKHLKSIEWLFSEGNRAEGRTTLLAYIYIQKALKGYRITIIDHSFITLETGYPGNRYLAKKIEDIIHDNNLPLEIEKTTFILKLKK